MRFLECVDLNPKIVMIKGQIYPFVEMANVSTCYRSPDNVDAKPFDSGVKFQDGDTVIARITPCLQNGKRFYCQNIGTGFGSTEYLVFRPKDDSVDSKYLYYFMMTDFVKLSMINSMTGATGRQRVNNDVFNDIEVCFPDIDIQRKIGEILSAYDNLIENNQKQIKLLEEAARRLYKEWFVDLRFPGYEDTPIVDGVPEGWALGELGDIAIDSGKKEKKEHRGQYQYYLPIDCLPKRSLAYTDKNDITLAESSLVAFMPNDILFGAMRPYFHKVVVARDKGLTRTTCFVINSKMPAYWAYLLLLLFSKDTVDYATQISVGTTMPYVRWKDFIHMPTLIPPEEKCDAFQAIVLPIIERISCLAVSSERLIQARDRLLPKLMSGEIEV